MLLRSLLLCLFICIAEILISQRHIHNVPEVMVSLQSADDGSLTTLSQSGNLYSFDGAEFTILQKGLQGASSIEKNKEGYIILAKNGIWKYSKGELEHQLMNEDCYSYISIEGKEFALTQTGMYLFKEGRYKLIHGWTTPIVFNAQFYQWGEESYLSNDKTIYTFKSGQWKVIARDTSIVNDLNFYQDDIWIATDSGLRIIKDKSLIQAEVKGLDSLMKIDKLFAFDKDLYVQSEGELLKWNSKYQQVSKVDFKSSTSNLVKDYWGDIWFAEEGNIIQHKVGNLHLSEPIISDITISVKGTDHLDQEITINEEGSDMKIDYSAIHLRAPKDIKFQSMLSPMESEYQSTTPDHSIVYNDMPAGEYTYRLRSTVDGIQYAYSNPKTIIVKAKDEISSLWWILGASCLLLLFLALLANYRLQGYKEKSALLTSKLRTANDLLKSQQKTMQLQMNPHFLFNALNSIQGLVSLNRNEEAKKYIRTFSRMMRSVLDFSTVEKIDLTTEIKYLEDYLSIEQMTRSNSFDFNLSVDTELIEDDVKVPPMILQPFIENAIVHGVASIKEGVIGINISDQETYLLCTISDNGIGREAASKKNASSHKSMAITLANERLQKLAKYKSKSMIQYKDLSQGTEVAIKIPL